MIVSILYPQCRLRFRVPWPHCALHADHSDHDSHGGMESCDPEAGTGTGFTAKDGGPGALGIGGGVPAGSGVGSYAFGGVGANVYAGCGGKLGVGCT